jgi:protein associated with RNAse G/E
VQRLCPGTSLEIRALRSDGNAYRWWNDTVVATEDDRVISTYPNGRVVLGPGGGWSSRSSGRTVYWFDRPYNLTEQYGPDGSLFEIYVHIASPARLDSRTLTYTDHELDVVLDEDEFREAARTFGYTPEFQASCYRAVEDVLGFIGKWASVNL